MTAAFIVWNEDKTEGVIFVQSEVEPFCSSAEEDAKLAATGVRPARHKFYSYLAEKFNEHIEDESQDGTIVETTAEALRSL